VDTTELDLGEIDVGVGGGIDEIGLAQDRNKSRALVNTVMNIRVP
jgi:hypothetical protein